MARQAGSKARTRSGAKYGSIRVRYAVCSGGSMPLGTEGWRETALLKVSWSSSTRTMSACRNTDQCR